MLVEIPEYSRPTIVRKIIHVDTQPFYAVEQRDDLQLRGKPVVVACKGQPLRRLRTFVRGQEVRSSFSYADSAGRTLCPEAIFVAPDSTR